MKRIVLLLSISVLAIVILASVYLAEAHQHTKVPLIGFMAMGAGDRSFRNLRENLRKLGYVEGQNIAIVNRSAYRRRERFPKLVAELVNLKVDVIVANQSTPALAAKKATTTIPIVVVTGTDLVRNGLVASYARPGGNVTGFSMLNPQLAGKQLELLKEAFPSVSRVAVLWDPDIGMPAFRQMEAAAPTLGVALHSMDMRGTTNADLDRAFQAAIKRRVDAFMVVASGFVSRHRKRLLKLLAKTQLPAIINHHSWVRRGGLMSYAAKRSDLYRSVAMYVDRILKGAKPGDLPVQRATRFYLHINLKTAKQLGLTISPEILFRADEVTK